MEGFNFDIEGLLSEKEAAEFFGSDEAQENEPDIQEPEESTGNVTDTEVAEVVETEEPESVGGGEEKTVEEKEDASSDDDMGSSPNVFYSSIANALKNDGIFPDLSDDEIKGVKSAEDFGELFEKAVQARLDDKQRRIDEALNNGVKPEEINQYEQTIQYLDGLNDEALTAEGDAGDNLRKQLLYNDLINRGFSQERATREVNKSFNAGTDVEDAKDALDSLRSFYKEKYDGIQKEAKRAREAADAQQKKSAEEFRKMVIDEDIVLGDQKLDQTTRQKVYDAVSKPIYKDPDTGRYLTQVQKFQKEKPLEFLKQLGLWYVLTDGGKDLVGFTKNKVRSEKHKAMRELEQKINANTFNSDGTLRYAYDSGNTSGDILLSDDWKIG